MRGILFILLVVFASVFDIYLSTAGYNPSTPAYTIIPLFFVLFVIRFNPRIYFSYFKTHTFYTFLAFVIIAIMYSVVQGPSTEAITTELVNAVITLLFYAFTLIIMSKTNDSMIRWFLFISLLVLIGSLLYDMFVGLDVVNEDLRKGGFAGNPNVAASAMKLLGLGLIYLYRDNKLIRSLLLVFIVLSVFMTFSRSGMLGILLMAFFLLINNWKAHFEINAKTVVQAITKMGLAFAGIYLILLTVTDYLKQEIPEFGMGDAARRIDMLLGKASSTTGTRDDQSRYGRKGLLIHYSNQFRKNPLGYGTGYTADKLINRKDTHNFYLKMAVNYGIIGLLALLLFFFISVKKAIQYDNYYYLIFIITIMAECIASHGIIQERPTLIALAFFDSKLYRLNEIN